MEAYLKRAEKIVDRINELASISEDENCIRRTFASNAFIRGRDKVQQWMQQAGLETRIDSIGNARGRLPSDVNNAKTFVIASHIDTVINAGKWDGSLGVIMGLDLLEAVQQNKLTIPFHIELIAFCDEEGVRYHTTYLGSKVVAGSFDDDLLLKQDDNGIALKDAIKLVQGDVGKIQKDAIAKNDWLGYFEIHIEQGPVLYDANIPAAVVTSIAGQQRIEITFTGEAGHAGTVPMHMRSDALCCAAEFILQTETYAFDNKENIVATTGKLTIANAASNVIAGEVICSLDVRSADDKWLSAASEHLQEICFAMGSKRNVEVKWKIIQQTASVQCDKKLIRLLSQAIQDLDYDPIMLVSGAGHDAVPIAAIAPVAMLFVRCFKGISHNPLENVELKDIEASVKISDNFIKNLIKHYQQ